MYDIVGLGELLIDFTDVGESENGTRLFERNPGGAVANVLCAAARFGMRTAFIGKVGEDMHGRFLADTLEAAGVDTGGITATGDAFTTLAFVSRTASGERSFSFARKPGADTLLAPADIDAAAIRNARVFHIGSLSLTDEPARSATYRALRAARESGAIISYDPNYRAPLWPDVETARKEMMSVLPQADLVKVSEEELRLLAGTPAAGSTVAGIWPASDATAACMPPAAGTSVPRAPSEEEIRRGIEIIAALGPRCVVVTMGERGAIVWINGRTARAPGFPCTVVDTTGAGDAFWGAFLYRLLEEAGKKGPGHACAGSDEGGDHSPAGNRDLLAGLTADKAAGYARFANAAAALCVGKRGAIPAMPTLEEVRAFMDSRG